MNTLEIRGDRNIVIGKLKKKWADLTNDDLTYVSSQEDELIGQAREAVEKELKSSCNCGE